MKKGNKVTEKTTLERLRPKAKDKKNVAEVTNICALCESRYADKRCGGCRERWYCSKECQTLHWKKGGHKQECRRLLQSGAEQARNDRLVKATDRTGEKSDEKSDKAGIPICAICLGPPERPVKLPCNHEFCRVCVGALRSRGLKQLCPLCRRPLPPGAEKLREQADRLYTQVERHVSRGEFSWSTLPPTFRRKMKNAEILYQESAAQGDAGAQYILGFMCMTGYGVSQDYTRAVALHTKAADQGHDGAQFNLGMMHLKGYGVTMNDRLAAKLIRKAAKQGHAGAQEMLDSM